MFVLIQNQPILSFHWRLSIDFEAKIKIIDIKNHEYKPLNLYAKRDAHGKKQALVKVVSSISSQSNFKDN